jgi:hypothetical protein
MAFHYQSFEGIVISLSKFANNQNDDASFCCPSQWIWIHQVLTILISDL